MKKFLHVFLVSISIFTAFMLPAVMARPAHAQGLPEQAVCEGSGGIWDVERSACRQLDNNRTVMGTIRQITSLLIFLAGAVSVIMIIIGGIKYATSQGDQAAIGGAKNTVLYAVVGLIISFMAYAIVNWVLDALNIR